MYQFDTFRGKNHPLFQDLVVNFVTSQYSVERKFDLLIDALLLQVSLSGHEFFRPWPMGSKYF